MATIIILSIVCFMLIIYIVITQRQIKNINELLIKRLKENSQQPISLELINRKLNILAANINKSLKAEEKLRLKVVNDEDNFKNMIANISHDLRTPLTSIKGYLQLMDVDNLDAKQREKINIVNKHVDELSALVEHFYEYIYLVDSKPKINLVTINLTNMVVESLASFVPLLEKNNFTVDIDDKPVKIKADREMTQRIINNLITNAIKHGKDNIRVFFEKDEYIKMHFINNINENDKIDTQKLFDRFYVSDESRKSTGLGLSIVKLLSEQMGGSVECQLRDNELDISLKFNKGE